ncbi:MAG: hypothetical protein JWP74_890 [Marmoricola sp.]|nr:hypothetical protein [Marmoricola sp.]
MVLPTRLMVLSISAVALAGLVFVATQGNGSDTAAPAAHSTPVASTPKAGTTPSSDPTTTIVPPTPKPLPVIRRAKTNVVVFNNSNVKGLAGKTATRAQSDGWNVVATDNWYGAIDASTVYFPPKMKPAATLLAHDLGIAHVKPAFAPMQLDRLTVILTADYH